MRQFTEPILVILLFTIPAYVLPLILGPIILRVFGKDELSKMAGLFTMKPLLATPLWAVVIALGDVADLSQNLTAVLGLIPGVGLTLWIVWRFHYLLRTETWTIIILLVVDALRWLNSFAWLIDNSLDSPFYRVGLILPNVYALMAFVIAWLRKRRSLQAVQIGM